MKNFFEKIFGGANKEEQNKPEPVIEAVPVAPERLDPLEEAAEEVLAERNADEETKQKLLKAFDGDMRRVEQSGGVFVTAEEADFLEEVIRKLNRAKVFSIDLNLIGKPYDEIKLSVDEFGDRYTFAFVRGFLSERLKQIDPDHDFESQLRHQMQQENWRVFMVGEGVHGYPGSISANMSTSLLRAEEKRLQR